MVNKEMNKLMDDIMIEKIATSPASELMAENNITADEIQTTQSRFLDIVKKHKKTYTEKLESEGDK